MEENLQDPLPEWLNSKFIQTALRSGDNNPNLTIINCRFSSASGKGDNFLGVLYRVAVTTSTGDQRSLIVKCTTLHELKGTYIKLANLFDIEIEMYCKTLPRMYELLRENFPYFKPLTPKYIYSNPDTSTIVLEDLSACGFRMAKRQKGLDLKHCELTLKSLAVLHAASVAAHLKDPSLMETYQEGIFKERTREFISVYFTSSIDDLIREIQNWPGFKERYMERLERLKDTYWDKIGPALEFDKEGFNVLNHGDLWVNNVMFSYSSSGEVQQVIFLDLQAVHYTSPAIDLIYFFYTSPTDEVRQKHFDHLIKTYHNAVKDTLTKLNHPEKIPTLETIYQHLKSRMALALFATICELPNMLAEQADVFELGDYFKEGERNGPKNNTFGGAEYKRVIQRLLPIFVDAGIL